MALFVSPAGGLLYQPAFELLGTTHQRLPGWRVVAVAGPPSSPASKTMGSKAGCPLGATPPMLVCFSSNRTGSQRSAAQLVMALECSCITTARCSHCDKNSEPSPGCCRFCFCFWQASPSTEPKRSGRRARRRCGHHYVACHSRPAMCRCLQLRQ